MVVALATVLGAACAFVAVPALALSSAPEGAADIAQAEADLWPSLRGCVHAAWILLNTAVLASPFIRLLTEAGTYGKLRAVEAEQGRADGAGATKPSSSLLHRVLLHPSLYVRTSTAFLAYYILAALWNGLLLAECWLVRATSSYSYAPTLRLLRALEWMYHPTVLLSDTLSSSTATSVAVNLLLLQMALFQAHLLRRVYESLWMTNFSSRSTQHALVTVMGLVYYFLCVLTPVVDSPLLGSTPSDFLLSRPWLHAFGIFIGMLLFVGGWCGQHIAHRTLAALRPRVPSHAQETKPVYSIPRGRMFALVSMPHYSCEMAEYTALWIIGSFKLSQFLVCVWVYSNLSITAVRSHQWYQRQFKDYPRERKAVIPFLL